MTDEQKQSPTSTSSSSDEIDLIQLAHIFWSGRRTIIKTMAIFAVLGLLIAIFSSKEYTATTIIVPQDMGAQSKLGGLSGLASMAGINLDMMNTSDITPDVYPQIISSVPFQLELMKTELTFREISHPVSLFEYYTEYQKSSIQGTVMKYTLGLPGVILKAIKGRPEQDSISGTNTLIQLTEDQKDIQKKLQDLLSIDYSDKEGYVTLICRMPEAIPAAQLAQKAQSLLQQYITKFKIQKASANLDFIQQRYDEVKRQYEQAQDELAAFRDRNRNMATATAQTELERLNNNYNLLYNVYSELAKQLEQARIQVKQDTPVFTVVQPASVPTEKSKPKRTMILIVWIFLGGIIGTGIIFSRNFFSAIKERWTDIGQDQSSSQHA